MWGNNEKAPIYLVFRVTESHDARWLAVALDTPGPASRVANTDTAPNFH